MYRKGSPKQHGEHHRVKIIFLIVILVLNTIVIKNYLKIQIPAKVIVLKQKTKTVFVYQTPKDKQELIEKVFGIKPELAKAFVTAGMQTSIDPILLASLAYTESTFNKYAISSKGYKGLMQTPKWFQFSSMDVLYGAEILKQKLDLAKGNIYIALAMYKGGLNQEARSEADYVLRIYRQALAGKRIGS
jgi:hypothetical protein